MPRYYHAMPPWTRALFAHLESVPWTRLLIAGLGVVAIVLSVLVLLSLGSLLALLWLAG